MNRLNRILVTVLALQLVVAGGIYYSGQPLATAQVQRALVDIDTDQVNRITILGGDGVETTLSRVDGQWQLPAYYQLPASENKVEQVLAALVGKHSGWPVATTAAGRERFKVEDDNFEKKIVLGDADKALATLYLGTSPGYRQLHVRRAGEDEVYAARLDGYQIASENDKWLDPALLQLKQKITRLDGPDYALTREGDSWRLDQGDGEVVGDEINKVTDTLAHLRVTAAADKKVVDTAYELAVIADDDYRFTYRFFTAGEDHYVGRSDFEPVFALSKGDYDKITAETATQLVRRSSPNLHSSASEFAEPADSRSN
jgi:hypothetical protein